MRLISITLLLWLCFTALVVGARAYGSTRIEPNPLRDIGFDVCDGQPCLRGIIPGVTTAEKAYEIALKFFKVNRYQNGGNIVASIDEHQLIFVVNPFADQIEQIDFSIAPNHEFPQLYSFIALYGLPCAVNTFQGKGNKIVDLRYPNMVLSVIALQERLNLRSNLDDVVLTNIEASTSSCMYRAGEGYITRPWMGFTSIEHYQRK